MSDRPTRRRAIRIFATAAATLVTGFQSRADEEWRGTALGAEVSIRFDGVGGARGKQAIRAILAEIERQEAIFSLQFGRSELCRLNADGRLDAPSADLRQVLDVARRIHAATRGKFDPTVQGLWRHYVEWYAADRTRPHPAEEAVARLRETVGFDAVRVAPDRISIPAGAALTLNGVAQGHITDCGARILRDLGFAHVLVDLGETRALGPRGDGAAWRVGLPDGAEIGLRDGAVATSAGAATRFADNGDHHIFDPHTGRPAVIWTWLSVAHPSAAVADALSTGLYCLEPDACAAALAAFPDARLWGRTARGETRTIGG